MAEKQIEKKEIHTVIQDFSEAHKNPVNSSLQWICISLLTFGILGIVWSVPFPNLSFLGKYNGFVNWASFLIAFSIYYYYKLSPILSYGILLFVFAFSAGIVGLEKLHTNQNWPTMGAVCLGVFMLGLMLQFFGYKYEGKTPGFSSNIKSLLNGPIWLMYKLFSKLGYTI
ncbi:Mpo1-like protein [Pedobacter sp. P351]|uniref:Mpo1 family 2-hydroxy fatty acid dioxygenase n=1 Tax=Pedobacter superstes TaxID=3133441 RepID=UPI0030A73D17